MMQQQQPVVVGGSDPSPAPQNVLALFHGTTTLRLLQERVALSDTRESTTDATILTVWTLAVVAETVGDRRAALNHRDGLFRMVTLRGGLGTLDGFDGKLRTKVGRADLSIALHFNCPPLFFRDGNISWEPYISTAGLIKGPLISNPQISNLFRELNRFNDKRLSNCIQDLYQFTLIANLASDTEDRKVDPNMFNEIMLSIMYRLIHLRDAAFENEKVDIEYLSLFEVVRKALVAFTITIFLQWQMPKKRYEYIADELRDGLLEARMSKAFQALSHEIQLWLLFTWAVYSGDDRDSNLRGDGGRIHWFESWVREILNKLRVRTWQEVREVLQRVMWIDCFHDPHGEAVFERFESER